MPSAFGNFFIKAIVNSPLHPLMGKNTAVITLTGRKTGKTISTPINVIRMDDALTVTSMRSRTWWRNLRNGRAAQLRHTGSHYPVRAELVEAPAEVAAGLAKIFVQIPGYARYFNVHPGADGMLNPVELEQAAAERVLIRLFPVGE